MNTAERNLYPPVARRDVLASQLMNVSEEYSRSQDELSTLQVNALSSFLISIADPDAMRENKQIYADLEKLSLENERNRLSALSPAEKQQLSEWFLSLWPLTLDLRKVLLNNVSSGKLHGMYYRG